MNICNLEYTGNDYRILRLIYMTTNPQRTLNKNIKIFVIKL